MTVFEHIEKLKRDYTDKFVLVDDRDKPALFRRKSAEAAAADDTLKRYR